MAIPWQLKEVMTQRANGWVQDVYDLCCRARKDTSETPSADFDRAVWAYSIEPFIVGSRQSGRTYNMSPLLDLLFCAVGVPSEKHDSLSVSQRDCCLNIRRRVNEAWYYRLNHLRSRESEAVAALSRYNALERRAQRMVAGLPPEDTPPQVPGSTELAEGTIPHSPDPVSTQSGESNGQLTPATSWDSIELSFLSDERVQIRNGAEIKTLNYAEFGFQDGRSGKPNGAWLTLREMAKNNRTLKHRGNIGKTWSIVEKNIQNVRKILKAHFGITIDPIPFVSNVGYQASFKIGCRRSFDS